MNTRRDRDWVHGIGLAVFLLLAGAVGLQFAQPGEERLFFLLVFSFFPVLVLGLTIAAAVKLLSAWKAPGQWALKALSISSALAAASGIILIVALFSPLWLPEPVVALLGGLFLAYPVFAVALAASWFARDRWG